MTRLAEVKTERDAAQRRLFTTEMAAMLALRERPDHTETIIEPDTNDRAVYRVSAYGLTRCDGGYIVVCFSHPGQPDTYRFHRFEDWRGTWSEDFTTIGRLFAIAAERIGVAQFRLLEAR